MIDPALEEWRNLVEGDDVDAAREWLTARRASGERVDLSQFLRTAAGWGAVKIVRLLIDSGAKVDAKDRWGMTALMSAAQGMPDRSARHLDCVQCLLECGADPNAKDRTGGTVLSHVFLEAEYATTPEALSLLRRTVATLLQHGADAAAPGASDAVRTAAGLKTTTFLELLLDAGAFASGSRRASAFSDTDLQELADDLGMAPDELKGFDQEELPTPLQMAIHAKNFAAVRLLLERGAQACDPVTKGRTPLLYAIEENAVELLAVLLEYGADINAPQGEFGWTPLMWACFQGANPEIVRTLVDRGASTAAIIEWMTALSIAYVNQRRELIDILLEHGVRERGFLGVILHRSAESADVQTRLNLDAGAVVANVLR
jgi:ankyrin repeat protein